MRRKRLLSLVLTLCMVLGMIAVPAYADNTTTISGDGTADKTATMTITLVIKSTPDAPAAPTAASTTKNSITLNTVEGCEYKLGDGEWQDNPTFSGLTPSTEYTFYQRVKATETANASESSPAAKISTAADTYAMTVTLVIENHEHSWNYTADGATITAACTGTGVCDVTEGLTLTISAPTGTLTYDGNAKPASLSTGYNATAFPGSYAIAYTKDGAAFNGEPTDAGAYTASVTVGTATASVSYSIGKADPAYTVPTDLTATYGDTLADVTLPTGWSWNDAATTSVGNAGSNSFNATFTPEDTANYNTATESLSITVSKATPAYTVPTGLTATYGDTLADVTLPTGWSWNDAATTSVGNAGTNTFKATFTPTDTANYNVIENVDVNVTVGKKAATITPNAATKTYGAEDPALTATVEGTVGTDTLNYTLSREAGNNVGAYTISVTLGENPNYEINTGTATFTISKKGATITPNAAGKTYGEDDPELTAVVEGLIGNDTLNYTLTRVQGDNAGTYEISVVLGENPNYEITTGTATFTISPKAAAVTADDLSKVYGEDDPALTATVTGLVGEDTLNYTLSRAEGQNVGEYEITVTLGENPNYDVTATNGTFTITKKAATVTADDKSKVYRSVDPELTATVEGLVGEDTLNYTLSREEGMNVGEYAIIVTLGENPNYDVTAINGVFTITQKAATIKIDDKTKAYGEDDPEFTAQITGTVANDTLDYALVREEGQNVGQYVITAVLGENPNFKITVTDGKLTITKADPDYTVPEGLVAIVGWTLADVTLPEGWTWNDPTTVIEEAGAQTFPATYTPEDTENYNVAENVDLTVTAKEMKFVDVADGSYYYNAVYWAVANGVTAGTSETTFSPNAGATRAQVVTFLWRAAGSPEPTTTECTFTDVKAGSYYEKAVMWAAENGVTAGTSTTTFSPDDPCTRAQVVTFLWRAAGSPEPTTTECKFTDVKAGSYYEKAVLWAAETGVTAGTSETAFSPDQPCTRAQVVTFLWRADKLTK